jgi:2-polyprenyl-3-methyl-5-hydroxy-6-metoxy-1,4-benzoquinol methylase
MKGDINTEVLEYISGMDEYNRWIFERIRPFCGQRILEVGCGIGNLTQFFADRELVVGVDMDKDHVRMIKNKFRGRKNMFFDAKRIEDVNAREYKKHGFDTILCLNVLEHIEDDSEALRKFRGLLVPGGRLVLQVPAFQWLYNCLDKHIDHYRRYSKKVLVGRTLKAGFRTEHCSFMNVWGIPGWYWNGSIMKKRILPEGQLKGFDRILPLLKLLDKPFNNIAGLSIIYSGRK